MEDSNRKAFNEKREKGNERVLGEDFLPFKRFFALDSRAYEDGEIPKIQGNDGFVRFFMYEMQ